ncbi:MAG: PilN domain-containing protein [Gudongella sp.]|nr:PilN domain-containing protein [Gudongella sp.]
MRDLNFFEPFIEKRQFKFDKIILLYSLLFIVLVGLIVVGGLNQVKIASLNKDVNSLKVVAEDPETNAKVNDIKVFEEETAQYKAEVERIIALDQSIQARDVIGDSLLKDINSKLPPDVFLSNMSASGWEIQISGFAEDKYAIAEFGKGLTELPLVEDVFISNISEVESYYNYNLEIQLREVLVDAN